MRVKWEAGFKREKSHEDKEDKNQNEGDFALKKGDIANKEILQKSHLNISFTSDEEELKTTLDADASQLSDETFDSTL